MKPACQCWHWEAMFMPAEVMLSGLFSQPLPR